MIRQLLVKLALLILPFAILVAVVNYTTDPANLYSKDTYVSGIARILADGHNVDNVSNYNERALQEYMVKYIPYTPEIVILGSSRIMEIDSTFYPGKKVLNCGVSHGTINDIMGVIGVLDSLHKMPSQFVIGVDPGLVSSAGTEEWKRLADFHHFELEYVTGTPLQVQNADFKSFKALLSLFSLSYFHESLAFMASGGHKEYVDVKRAKPQSYGRFANGTVCYSHSYTNPDTVKVAVDAKGDKNIAPDITSREFEYLSMLLASLKKRHIDVTLVMVPFHDAYFANLNLRMDNIFVKAERKFKSLGAESGATVIGGFNPADFSLHRRDFYDRFHCSKDALKRICKLN